MWVENASSHNTIDSTLVRDTGAGGIRVGTGKPLQVSRHDVAGIWAAFF